MLESFFDPFHSLLCSYQHQILKSRVAKYAEVFVDSGEALVSCVRFIDATNTCKARLNKPTQTEVYNGHKRQNALKIQRIKFPDELVLHMSGLIEARRHEITLYRTVESP